MRREPPKPKPRGHGQQRRRALQHAYQARRRHPLGEHRGEMNETDGKDEQEEKLHQRPLAFAALPSPPIEVEQEQGDEDERGADDTVGNGMEQDERRTPALSLIHISEPTRLGMISYAVFCLKKKK